MVTRKAVGQPQAGTELSANRPDPPYPITPIDSSKIPASTNSIYSPDLNVSPAFDLIDMNEARTRPRRDSDVSSHGTWDSDGDDETDEPNQQEVEVPKPLRFSASKQTLMEQAHGNAQNELPAILRPGPANGALANKRKSTEALQYEHEAHANPWAMEGPKLSQSPSGKESHNPYLRAKATGAGSPDFTTETSHAHPQPPPPSIAPPAPPSIAAPLAPTSPVELAASSTPVSEMSRLSLTRNQNQAQRQPYETAEVLLVPPAGQTSNLPVNQQTLHQPETRKASLENTQQPTAQQKWDYVANEASASGPTQQLIDHHADVPPPPSKPISEISEIPDRSQPLPPTFEQPLAAQPPAPATRADNPFPQVPDSVAKRQRSENYQIKHINWYDSSNGHGRQANPTIRRSPILTQNANGPCPLLALVNALVLATPQHQNTALVETLRTREQVSLGLLLDAVFDELVSGRNHGAETELPDVGDLYSFLLALHTGMNVNPRFIEAAPTYQNPASGRSADTNGLGAGQATFNKAGCFEDTREMRLYSTFQVPLIHGWLPPQHTPAYQAFERCAQTFEDAQNIQFAESELEEKLRAEGLSPQEQQALQDIQTIKHFLSSWPTQLTDHGLQSIARTLPPGKFAILFRNDHFSTLYKEPRHGTLMTLVTDTGYSSHDEIVWESLVDVNGATSEMYSGDFRAVSHNQDVRLGQVASSDHGDAGWQTVQSGNIYHAQQPIDQFTTNGRPTSDEVPPPLPGPRPQTQHQSTVAATNESLGTNNDMQRTRSEQEDHDLALALQLQEEEEAHQRQDQERRQREQQLSEQLLSHQTEGRPPAIPPRRGGSRQSTSTRPAVSRPGDDSSNPDAPPTYEQSASDRPYREAGSIARPAQGNPLSTYDALRRQQQAQPQSTFPEQGNSPPMPGSYNNSNPGRQSYGNRMGRQSQNGFRPNGLSNQAGSPNNPNFPGRRPANAANAQDAEDKCIIM